jgi:hypothetical protein
MSEIVVNEEVLAAAKGSVFVLTGIPVLCSLGCRMSQADFMAFTQVERKGSAQQRLQPSSALVLV